jgi:hypothetical protein
MDPAPWIGRKSTVEGEAYRGFRTEAAARKFASQRRANVFQGPFDTGGYEEGWLAVGQTAYMPSDEHQVARKRGTSRTARASAETGARRARANALSAGQWRQVEDPQQERAFVLSERRAERDRLAHQVSMQQRSGLTAEAIEEILSRSKAPSKRKGKAPRRKLVMAVRNSPTQKAQVRSMVRGLHEAVLDAVRSAGPGGVPESSIYVGLTSSGVPHGHATQLVAAMVRQKDLRRRNHVLYAA